MIIQIEIDHPWNGECEMCYGRHKFKADEVFFHILHPWSPDEPINVCQICWFVSNGKLLSMQRFVPKDTDYK